MAAVVDDVTVAVQEFAVVESVRAGGCRRKGSRRCLLLPEADDADTPNASGVAMAAMVSRSTKVWGSLSCYLAPSARFSG